MMKIFKISLYMILLLTTTHVWSLGIKGYTNGQKITRCKNTLTYFEPTAGPYSNYKWYFSSTSNPPISETQSFSTKYIDQTGSAFAFLIFTADSAGFTLQTTLEVYSANNPPKPDLGPDRVICQGDSIVLQNSVTMSSTLGYSWNNPYYGNADNLKVGSTGVYVLFVENALKCRSSDTAHVKVILNSASLPATINLCTGDELELKSNNPIETGHTIVWSTGATTPTIVVKQGGVYNLSVKTGFPSDCNFKSSTEIFLRDKPEVILGGDTLMCLGGSVLLKNKSTKVVNSLCTRIWNNDPNQNNESVLAEESKKYNLKLVSPYGCTDSDEVDVQVFDPNFTLGKDTVLCTEETILLTPKPSLPKGTIHLWNGIKGESDYKVEKEGHYFLEATHPKLPNCRNIDTINVSYLIKPKVDLGEDLEDSLEVSLDVSDNGKYDSLSFDFIWTNLDDSEIVSSSSVFTFHETIIVSAYVKTKNYRCFGTDTVQFTKVNPIPPKTIFVPNVFSASASKVENRVFKVMGTAVDESSFQVLVYDRWGNVIFQSNDFKKMNSEGWDGKLKSGKMLTSGVYTFVLKSKYIDGEEISKNGSVTFVP